MTSTNTLITGLIITLLMVILTGMVINSLNTTYDKDYSIGLDTGGLDSFSTTFDSAYNNTIGGDVEQTDGGLSLTSSWAIGLGLFKVTWNFINGSWINNLIINILGMGEAGAIIATVIRILFVSILIFSIIKLFFKIDL